MTRQLSVGSKASKCHECETNSMEVVARRDGTGYYVKCICGNTDSLPEGVVIVEREETSEEEMVKLWQ